MICCLGFVCSTACPIEMWILKNVVSDHHGHPVILTAWFTFGSNFVFNSHPVYICPCPAASTSASRTTSPQSPSAAPAPRAGDQLPGELPLSGELAVLRAQPPPLPPAHGEGAAAAAIRGGAGAGGGAAAAAGAVVAQPQPGGPGQPGQQVDRPTDFATGEQRASSAG